MGCWKQILQRGMILRAKDRKIHHRVLHVVTLNRHNYLQIHYDSNFFWATGESELLLQVLGLLSYWTYNLVKRDNRKKYDETKMTSDGQYIAGSRWGWGVRQGRGVRRPLNSDLSPYLSPSVSFFTFVPSLFLPPPLSPSPSFLFISPLHSFDNTLVAQTVKNLPAMQDTWVWKIPWKKKWQPTLVFFIPLSILFLLFQHLPSSSIFVFSNRNSWAF